MLGLQPGKCLYTTVRELVENSLDAAESRGALPEIAITMYASNCMTLVQTSQLISGKPDLRESACSEKSWASEL